VEKYLEEIHQPSWIPLAVQTHQENRKRQLRLGLFGGKVGGSLKLCCQGFFQISSLQ